MKTVWKNNEIVELEQRLKRTQSALTLHICALSRYRDLNICSQVTIHITNQMLSEWQIINHRQLEELRRETARLNAQQFTKLDEINEIITKLSYQFEATKSNPKRNPLTRDSVTSLEQQLANLSISKTTVRKQHSILRSLTFESRPIRYVSIAEAHMRTFEWIFAEPIDVQAQPTADNLFKWLK